MGKLIVNADLTVQSKVWNDKKLSAHHAIILPYHDENKLHVMDLYGASSLKQVTPLLTHYLILSQPCCFVLTPYCCMLGRVFEYKYSS
jgi:hypothetical protein